MKIRRISAIPAIVETKKLRLKLLNKIILNKYCCLIPPNVCCIEYIAKRVQKFYHFQGVFKN